MTLGRRGCARLFSTKSLFCGRRAIVLSRSGGVHVPFNLCMLSFSTFLGSTRSQGSAFLGILGRKFLGNYGVPGTSGRRGWRAFKARYIPSSGTLGVDAVAALCSSVQTVVVGAHGAVCGTMGANVLRTG